MTLLLLVSVLFPSRCYPYDMKQAQLASLLLGYSFYIFVLSNFFVFVALPVAAPPGWHDSNATNARFVGFIFSPLAFVFCPSVF